MTTAQREETLTGVWSFMERSFGSRWRREFGQVGGAAFRDWAFALGRYTPGEIRAACQQAIDEARANDRGEIWPPNLAEFNAFCRAQLGPPAAIALREAVDVASRRRWEVHDWTHAAIYRAASALGSYYLNNATARELARTWRSAYAAALDDVATGAIPKTALAASERHRLAASGPAAPMLAG